VQKAAFVLKRHVLTQLMVQLTLVEMAASGTTAILKVVENMMTTILSQIQSAVHVEVEAADQILQRNAKTVTPIPMNNAKVGNTTAIAKTNN